MDRAISDPIVCIVEDDFRTRKALRALLEAYDMTVRDYASADVFLAETGRPKMACLVLDLHMRGLTGLDLLKQLRSQGQGLPVVVMTGDPSLREQADRFGASAFLEKPIAAAVLSLTVRKALTSYRPCPVKDRKGLSASSQSGPSPVA